MKYPAAFRSSLLGLAFLALAPTVCHADGQKLLGVIASAMETHPDDDKFIAKAIREHYNNDEGAILRDAMELVGGEYGTVLFLLAELKPGAEARLSLVSQLIGHADYSEANRVTAVLSMCDRVPSKADSTAPYDNDISAHAAWLRKDDLIPAEYAAYLFVQNSEQAWKLLGSGDQENPQVKALSRLGELLKLNGSRARIGRWRDEFLPIFAEGLKFSDPDDARYLASFIGRGSVGSPNSELNKQLTADLEKFLPGCGAILMLKEGGPEIKRTSPEEAAKWMAEVRKRAAAK